MAQLPYGALLRHFDFTTLEDVLNDGMTALLNIGMVQNHYLKEIIADLVHLVQLFRYHFVSGIVCCP